MKRLITFSVLFLIVYPVQTSFAAAAKPQAEQQEQLYTVERAVDGDTLKLSNGEKVRLIGVDTPESADNPKLRRDAKKTGQDRTEIIKMGKEAAEFTRKLVEGKQVRLEYDIQQRDKYGRLLAYVSYLQYASVTVPISEHLEGHGIGDVWNMLNAELVRAGYAQVMTVPPNVKYQELFVKLEKEAREQRRGLWG